LSKRYNKFPYGIKYENSSKDLNIVIPNEDDVFGSKKVIKLYYGKNSTAYFNYLN
jgi:hypothetical protein